MIVMNNFAFHRLGGRGLPSHFASCPPPFGLLLYLRKAPRQTTLGVGVLMRELCTTAFVALGVVCLPQRSQGGGLRPGDMSEGRYAAPKAELTAPKADRTAHQVACSA
jgi:hypothetical protein